MSCLAIVYYLDIGLALQKIWKYDIWPSSEKTTFEKPSLFKFKGAVMHIEKTLINDRLLVSKISHSNYL